MRLRISLCRMIVTPLVGHERACIVCGESCTANTCSWQIGRSPVVANAECIMKCTFVKCKAMGSKRDTSILTVFCMFES